VKNKLTPGSNFIIKDLPSVF